MLTQTNDWFGLEWAHELEEGILANRSRLSCMEIIPENFFEGRFAHFLEALRVNQIPTAVHGVLLSIGSMAPLKTDHLEKVLAIARQVPTVHLSEHLSLTEVESVDLDALTPLAWTKEVVEGVSKKVRQVQERIDVPFLLENVSNRFVVPGGDYTETQFINEILSRTGCGLLLDVTNVYTNSVNFKFDPYRWIDEINMDVVGLIHLAGGFLDADGFLMDSHDNTVAEESWKLYRYALEKAPPTMTIIERTGNFPNIDVLMAELDRSREVAGEARKNQGRLNSRGLVSNQAIGGQV